MKRVGFLLIAFLLMAGISNAQERGDGDRPSKSAPQSRQGVARPNMSPDELAQRMSERLVEELKLNKDQEAKVIAINKKYNEKRPFDFAKMRDASDAERAKMREEMMKIQAERNKEIRAVLTPEQAKIFDENQKKREEMRKNGQGRGNFGGGPR